MMHATLKNTTERKKVASLLVILAPLLPSAGFNPVWNETLNFVIHAPDLALVRFEVEDYDKASRNDFIGQFTLPFTCIQAGEQRGQWVPNPKAWHSYSSLRRLYNDVGSITRGLKAGCMETPADQIHLPSKFLSTSFLSRISSHSPALQRWNRHPSLLPLCQHQHLRARMKRSNLSGLQPRGIGLTQDGDSARHCFCPISGICRFVNKVTRCANSV